MSRRRAPATRLLAVAIALGACLAGMAAFAGPASARRRVGTTTTTTTWPPNPVIDATVAWSACNDGFECGTLTVPVDWRRPHGDTLPLALIRHPATDPAARVGPLVVNYGGPGESGVQYLPAVWSRLPEEIRARFDVVSFDPRGTGASRPASCVDDTLLDLGLNLPPIPSTAAQLAAVHQFVAAFAAGCASRMGSYAGQIGTRNAARDLDAIRVALGVPALRYLGYSYGTILGETYAQMFPGNVGSMVLDGPPDYSLSTDAYDYAQAQGFAHALTDFFSWCATTSCRYAHGGDPRAALDALIARVDHAPIPASYEAGGIRREGTLGSAALGTGVLALLYDRARGWPILSDDLAAAEDGVGSSLLAVGDQYLGRSPDGHYSPVLQANAVISCVDRPDDRRLTTAQELATVARFQAALPPFGGRWAVSSCLGMPHAAPGDVLGDVRVHFAPPILVVGTTGDPATPYAGAEATVRRIKGARLLTYDSTEHTGYGSGRSRCVDAAGDAYLLTGALPPVGAHCPPG